MFDNFTLGIVDDRCQVGPLFFSQAQDLQFECISCDDKLEKCQLDCSWANMDTNLTYANACFLQCDDIYNDCDDSVATSQCRLCILDCAKSYDQSLRRCLAAVDDSSKSTFGSSQSECTVFASFDMDRCMTDCSPQDGSIKSVH